MSTPPGLGILSVGACWSTKRRSDSTCCGALGDCFGCRGGPGAWLFFTLAFGGGFECRVSAAGGGFRGIAGAGDGAGAGDFCLESVLMSASEGGGSGAGSTAGGAAGDDAGAGDFCSTAEGVGAEGVGVDAAAASAFLSRGGGDAAAASAFFFFFAPLFFFFGPSEPALTNTARASRVAAGRAASGEKGARHAHFVSQQGAPSSPHTPDEWWWGVLPSWASTRIRLQRASTHTSIKMCRRFAIGPGARSADEDEGAEFASSVEYWNATTLQLLNCVFVFSYRVADCRETWRGKVHPNG